MKKKRKMKRSLETVVFVLIMFIAQGCGKSGGDTPVPQDSESPEMSISKPAEGTTVVRSNDLKLAGTFSDDMELESLTVTIAFNDTKAYNGINDPWEPSNSPETINLSGTNDELVNHTLFGEMIPADCKVGNYVLKLDLKDKSGKTTSKLINIVIGG
jgi:hypothetical protein